MVVFLFSIKMQSLFYSHINRRTTFASQQSEIRIFCALAPAARFFIKKNPKNNKKSVQRDIYYVIIYINLLFLSRLALTQK